MFSAWASLEVSQGQWIVRPAVSQTIAHSIPALRLKLPYQEVPVSIRYTPYSLAKGQKSRDALRILLDYLVSRIAR